MKRLSTGQHRAKYSILVETQPSRFTNEGRDYSEWAKKADAHMFEQEQPLVDKDGPIMYDRREVTAALVSGREIPTVLGDNRGQAIEELTDIISPLWIHPDERDKYTMRELNRRLVAYQAGVRLLGLGYGVWIGEEE